MTMYTFALTVGASRTSASGWSRSCPARRWSSATGLKKASFGVSLQVERLIVLAQEEDEEEEDDVAG
jgi:hypothetical protein